MANTLSGVSPSHGPQTGGTTITVTGTGLDTVAANIYLRFSDHVQMNCRAVTQTATQITAVTPDMSARPTGPADVGVFDTAASAFTWLLGAFNVDAPTFPPGVWDGPAWDGVGWQATQFAPGAGWGSDWQVWFQDGVNVVWDMTASVVEARWTTDSYTTGDGSFRGDLQPGSLQMQIHDAGHRAETLPRTGTIWLRYLPANLAWGFYLDTVTRQLVAPTDPTAADVVIQGSAWPVRLTTDCLHTFTRPAERADTRLTAIAAWLSQNTDLALPRYTANVAAQSHAAPAVAAVPTWGTYPAALTLIREAAADGVAWLTASTDGTGAGQFALNYARWETAPPRDLVASDVVAGIPYDASMDSLISAVEWTGMKGDGTTIVNAASGSKVYNYGFVKASMRVLADLGVGTADQSAVNYTGLNLINTHSDPTPAQLSAVTCTSGPRTTPAGATGPPWRPTAHVWTPNEVLNWVAPAGQTWGYTAYRVVKTAHRLRAAAWDSAHTVEPYTPASPLPA